MFTFLLFFCAMQCCLFLSVSNWHGLSINYSTNRKIVNLNLVRSLAIKLPHTLKCNLQFTIIVIVIVTIVNCNNNKHQNCSHSLHQNIPPEYTVILTTWQSNLTVLSVRNDTGLVILMAQTCSLTFWEMNYVFWARDWLLQEIHGVLLFVRVVLRNALTVLQMSRMIREMYQSDWEKL